jgi:undecaprenyl-diphosphatase
MIATDTAARRLYNAVDESAVSARGMMSYLRAIIDFVATYPHMAYGLVFLAALSEALPVAGVLVPGSLVILTVSALVTTGAVALWPLLAWATAGAVVGDGFSYWLGRRYKREILLRWPFTRYPQVTAQSEAFFDRHGGKSVFLGRFVPALRSFVPLFAGSAQPQR